MKAIMITVRLWWFYLTYKGIKTAEIRRIFAKDFKGKIFECVSKTNWKKDLMKIPEEEREFFKQFVGKVGLCFECDKVEEILSKENGNFYTNFLSNRKLLTQSCLTQNELRDYMAGNWKQKFYSYWYGGYAIHIDNLVVFDKPKEIKEFSHYDNSQYQALPNGEQYRGVLEPLTRAPQSYMYIEI